jgi:zinc protease
VLALLATALPALVRPAAAQEPAPVRIESFTLPNGLRVHVVEDHSAQVVAVNLWYDVGSRNERPGRTGFAHLFEHMMFQGSANVGKMEHGQLIERAGGVFNGSTQPDRTDYFQVVPSNRLNLALWLEADRMRSLAITAENLDNQREAVKEERRLRVDNQPYSPTFIDSLPTLFDGDRCFAYAHSVIGSMDDLNAATVEDVRSFFAQFYAPNNAALVVVGDVTVPTVRRLAQQYFGSIPAGPAKVPVTCEAVPGPGVAVLKRVVDGKATLPAVLTAFRTVPPSHADYPALVLLSTILGEGESSRLNRSLVRGSQVAVAAQALLDPFGPMRAAGSFAVLGVGNSGISVDTLQAQVLRAVARAGEEVTQQELEKAKNVWRARTVFGRQQALAVSEAVHFAAMFLGNPEAVNTDASRYAAVTLPELRRVARTYLRADRAFTLQIVPEER